jgi:hypothetical protein
MVINRLLDDTKMSQVYIHIAKSTDTSGKLWAVEAALKSLTKYNSISLGMIDQ